MKTTRLTLTVTAALALMTLISACKKEDDISDSFKIAKIQKYFRFPLESSLTFCIVISGPYTNTTEKFIEASGTIDYGDGTSAEITLSREWITKLEPRTVDGFFIMEVENCYHAYPAAGRYHVKVKATAFFPDKAITSTFEKDIQVD